MPLDLKTWGPGLKLNLGAGTHRQAGKDWRYADIRSLPGIDYVFDAGHVWPLALPTFAYILARDVIEHMPEPNGQRLLAEAHRALAPGGLFVVSFPNLSKIGAELLSSPDRAQRELGIRWVYGRQDYPENTHVTGYTWEGMQESLQAAGFTDLVLEAVHFNYYFYARKL